ncbi:hypothetical protein FPOA_08885 [Fusarium poae]|uniref:Uncharacterized protein n=1 Tax=Fusarium poae TaxID=36050 RepID=A0A1B8APW9_FUSPO|nr:hypothetical protein FPOA_08885 [Fusarium poae]
MGGLVVKQAINTAKTRSAQTWIFDVPTGVCFFGTPHRGATSAKWAELGNNLSNAVRLGQGGGRNATELKFFSNTVIDIHRDFVRVSKEFIILSFMENIGCKGIGLVVEQESARMDIPNEHAVLLNANHTDLCKFASSGEDNWGTITTHIESMASKLVGRSSNTIVSPHTAAPAPSSSNSFFRGGEYAQGDPRGHSVPNYGHETKPSYELDESAMGTSTPSIREVTNDIPFFLSHNFSNRPDNILEQMLKCFKKEQGSRMFGLYGQIGVGKTQLALKFMEDNRKLFPIQFWVSADKKDKIYLSYESIAEELGIGVIARSPKQTTAVVRKWLESNHRWLVVFDNVEDLSLVTSFWPRHVPKTSYIIVTTRDHSISSPGTFTATAEVKSFPVEAAVEYFWSRVSDFVTDLNQRSLVKEVVLKLDCLPLVMNHVAAYISVRGMTLSEFLEEYKVDESIAIAQKISGTNASYIGQHSDGENIFTIMTPWNLSISDVATHRPEASALLDLLVLLDPDKIPLDLIRHFRPGHSQAQVSHAHSHMNHLHQAINDLVFKSLLDQNKDPKNRSLRVHRMTQAAARRLWTPESRATAFDNAIHCICMAYPRQEQGGSMVALFSRCAMFTAHLRSILHYYQNHGDGLLPSEDFPEILAHCGWYFFERGETESALEVLLAAESICKELRITESQTLGLIYNNLGAVFMLRRGKEKDGLKYTKLAIENRELSIPQDNPEIQQLGISYMNYANDMQLVEPFNQAEQGTAAEYYNKALDICVNFPGGTARSQELVLSNMSYAYYRWGNLQAALGYVQRAVALHEVCAPDTSFMLYTMYYYGNIQWALGDRQEGFRIHKQCLKRRQILFDGNEHYTTGLSLYKTGSLAFVLGELDYARQRLTEAETTFSEYRDDPGLWPRALLKLGQILLEIAQRDRDRDMEAKGNITWMKGLQEAKKVLKDESFQGRNDEELDSLVRQVYR